MIDPHNVQQAGSVGEMHDGRVDADHEAELGKMQERGEVTDRNSEKAERPHEEK